MSCSDILGSNFGKLLSHLRSTPSHFLITKFSSKMKIFNLRPKMPDLRILKLGTKNFWFWRFWARNWKCCCHNWNQHPRICLIAKLGAKTKILKFGTKNALFRYFWAGIWEYCNIRNQRPWIWITAKFRERINIPFPLFLTIWVLVRFIKYAYIKNGKIARDYQTFKL